MSQALKYVLITPARNEVAFIEKTIESVLKQTILPRKWIIVSDGSTDGTDDVVKKYVPNYTWIELVRAPERAERHFAGKVHAFNAGYEHLRHIDYDIIGNLDADISFDADYIEYILNKFIEFPELGVAGTPFREGVSQYDYRFSRKEHVSGACQLFRRECFEAIGGYLPLKAGGVDLACVVTARMKGWRTETFTGTYCVHHRIMGTGGSNRLAAAFKSGYGDYPMGVHPIWQLFRSIYQMSRKPLVVGGMMLLFGYCWALIQRAKSPVSMEFFRFRRREQIQWLNDSIIKHVPFVKTGKSHASETCSY
ncbi:glycosyltransferase family 2 protein [candidate division KSB1 bacterium]|nr:glycosyltransferase family 2 protein [candidate division KSB1 bacterium]RQW01224.1 MAG: glycosyltransferase family 2 protein [candidate division KSB1 bacterium]